nr:homocysteine S-methyltransferase family protein [Fredinandcohnia onubensis]
MTFPDILMDIPLIFTEGAVAERLRREFSVQIDPLVAHSALIYQTESRAILRSIYKQYIDSVKLRNAPILIFTPTRRANPERIALSRLVDRDINRDCARFLIDIRNEYSEYKHSIYIGGIMGCKGDAYKAEEALQSHEAFNFHCTQAEKLTDGGVDFLFGATLPATSEAIGLAMAMARTGKSYIVSFVIRPNGTLLDGISLHDAISRIDNTVTPRPACYMVNCVHPSVLISALTVENNCSDLVRQRLIGIQANTSSKSPEELDGSSDLMVEDDVEELVDKMVQLRKEHHLRIFGGCCGTDNQHIQQLVERIPL